IGFLIVMATLGVTAKLSSVVAVELAVLAGFAVAVSRGASWRALAAGLRPTVAFAAVFGAVWAARGVAQSGCPAYPASLFCVATDWSVPLSNVRDEASWVYSWARWPGRPPSEVLGHWDWLSPWWD